MNKKILIIDDEESISFTMKTFFTSKGFEVIVPLNLDDTWELLKNSKPDLVITDHFMPNINAIDVIKNVRKESSHVPILVMSGFKVGLHLENYKNIPLIQKPIDLEDLYLRIMSFFKK